MTESQTITELCLKFHEHIQTTWAEAAFDAEKLIDAKDESEKQEFSRLLGIMHGLSRAEGELGELVTELQKEPAADAPATDSESASKQK